METDNYLSRVNHLDAANVTNFCTTNNFDEEYEKIFLNISRKELWERSVQYDQHYQENTKFNIQEHFDLSEVSLGAGIEELIIRLRVLALQKEWKVCIAEPCFYRSKEVMRMVDHKFLDEMNLDFDFSPYHLALFTNPNTLSGNIYDRGILLQLLTKFPETTFIIDEASMFTIPTWDNWSLLKYADKVKNLVVLSSFSKIYGIPLQRVAFAAGNKTFLQMLNDVGPTFPFTALSGLVVDHLLKRESFIDKLKNRIQLHKLAVKELVGKIDGVKLLLKAPINCMYIQTNNPTYNLYQNLLDLGVMGLNVSEIFKSNTLRLTIHSSRTKQEYLLDKLEKFRTIYKAEKP